MKSLWIGITVGLLITVGVFAYVLHQRAAVQAPEPSVAVRNLNVDATSSALVPEPTAPVATLSAPVSASVGMRRTAVAQVSGKRVAAGKPAVKNAAEKTAKEEKVKLPEKPAGIEKAEKLETVDRAEKVESVERAEKLVEFPTEQGWEDRFLAQDVLREVKTSHTQSAQDVWKTKEVLSPSAPR